MALRSSTNSSWNYDNQSTFLRVLSVGVAGACSTKSEGFEHDRNHEGPTDGLSLMSALLAAISASVRADEPLRNCR
jgi:hypothetical protein